MAAPPIAMGALAADIYHQLRLLVPDDEENGWSYAHYIAAKYGPGELVESWARDTDDGPGWSILLDLDRCPEIALPWLAQFKGAVIPAGMPPGDWREWVRTAEGLRRGQVPALIAAGQRHLTGTRGVRVILRTGPTWYHTTVITRTTETPDPAVTFADLMSAKRIGIVLTHIVSDEPLIDEWTRNIDATTANIDSFTLADVT